MVYARICFMICMLISSGLNSRDCDGRDVLFEFKGGAFIPTHCDFRSLYGSGTYFISPELSIQAVDHANWYVFASAGYAAKDGLSEGLCDCTTARLIPLALGIKYVFQHLGDADLCRRSKWYLGIGFQPELLKTYNASEYVYENTSNWGFGGIFKIGCMVTLPHHFYMNFFADYSFVTVHAKNPCWSGNSGPCCGDELVKNNYKQIEAIQADISGLIIGIGLGFSF